jgi:hypothetical protein
MHLFALAATFLTGPAALAADYQLSPPQIKVDDAANTRAIVPSLECETCAPVATAALTPRPNAPPSTQPIACLMAEMPLGPSLPGCTRPPLDLTAIPPR